jgi:peptide deformylase
MPEKVLLVGDPVLRQRCREVNLSDIPSYTDLLNAMHDTMKAENGVGLAANQIGHSLRIFILKTPQGFAEYFNPEVISESDLVDFEGEGCLSIPGVSAKTKRFKSVRLTWLDKNGIRLENDFTGMDAFAIQHEMEHLQGKLFIDNFGPLKRQLIMDKHRKFVRRQ